MAAPAVAVLDRCFMLDARDLAGVTRICSLQDGARADLQARWSACVSRRGPLAIYAGALKLEALLPGADSDVAARAVADALLEAWSIESEEFDNAGTEPANDAERDAVITHLADALERLAIAASNAAAALRSHHP